VFPQLPLPRGFWVDKPQAASTVAGLCRAALHSASDTQRSLSPGRLQLPPPLCPAAVVKCRVLAHDPAHKGLKLSLVSKKHAAKAVAAVVATAPADQGADEGAVAADAADAAAAANPAGQAEHAEAAGQGDALGGIQPGDIVAGIVKSVQTKEVRS
jgi:hypothetical protein